MYVFAPSALGPFMFYAKSKLSEGQDIIAAVSKENCVKIPVYSEYLLVTLQIYKEVYSFKQCGCN